VASFWPWVAMYLTEVNAVSTQCYICVVPSGDNGQAQPALQHASMMSLTASLGTPG
jgi:hypothetical protein